MNDGSTFPWSTLLAMLSFTIHRNTLQYRFLGSQHNSSYQRYSQVLGERRGRVLSHLEAATSTLQNSRVASHPVSSTML